MIDRLFSSKVVFDILSFLFKKDGKKITIREIVRTLKKDQPNALRSLEKLTSWDFVKKEKIGKINLYSLNKENKYFHDLKNIFHTHSSPYKQFFLVNEESGVSALAWSYFVKGFSDQRAKKYGLLEKIPSSFAQIKNGQGYYYMHHATWQENSKKSINKLISDPDIISSLVFTKSIEKGEEAKKLFLDYKKNGKELSKSKATEMIGQFSEIIAEQIAVNHIAVYDLIDQPFSKYLKKYIDKVVIGTNYTSAIVIEKILMPTHITNSQLMRKDLLELVLSKQSENRKNEELRKIWENWKWLNYGYRGPVFTFSYFQHIYNELKSKPLHESKKALNAILLYEVNAKKDKESLYDALNIDKKHRKFIDTLSLLSFLKVYRKDTAFLLIYLTYEILSIFNTSVRKKYLHCLTFHEVIDLINGVFTLSERTLAQREKECVLLLKGRRISIVENPEKFVNENVSEQKTSIMENGIRMLEGITASLGLTGDWVYGTARIINRPEDMSKMNDGDILISVATTPEILLAMKKASAIVTDHGGITCHAAIVSRELNIPCLIATKYATKVFQDGDKVVMCPRHAYIKFQ